MKVAIPLQHKETELSEKDIVLIGLILLLAQAEGYDKWFNFCIYDIKRLYTYSGCEQLRINSKVFTKLSNVLDIAIIDEYNIMFRLKAETRLLTRHGALKLYSYQLKEPRSIGVWGYLLGRIHNSESVFSANTELFKYKEEDDKSSIKDNTLFKLGMRIR